MNPETIVEMKDVTKNYRRDAFELKVLQGISLSIQQGDYVALMGPSGSGKSTLLNVLAGIDRPSSGEMVVAGERVSHLSERKLARWRRRHVGFIFQFYNLIPVLTAFENVELPLALRRSSRAARRKRVETALTVVGLRNRMKHYPRQLSGGQEQRVAIARAIVTDPTLLLADEPTGDLDADSGREVLDLLGRLNEQFDKTILMVTHDPNAAARAKRLLRLHRGRLVSSEIGAVR